MRLPVLAGSNIPPTPKEFANTKTPRSTGFFSFYSFLFFVKAASRGFLGVVKSTAKVQLQDNTYSLAVKT